MTLSFMFTADHLDIGLYTNNRNNRLIANFDSSSCTVAISTNFTKANPHKSHGHSIIATILACIQAPNIDQFRRDLDTSGAIEAMDFLFVMESSNNNRDLAKTHLDAALAILQKGGPEERRLAATLGPDGDSNSDEVLKLLARCRDKLAWMAALAVRFPDDSENYKGLATKLNFEPTPPFWWLKQWLAQP